ETTNRGATRAGAYSTGTPPARAQNALRAPQIRRLAESGHGAILAGMPVGVCTERGCPMLQQYGMWIALACAIVAILYGVISASWIMKQPAGNDRMREIAQAIQVGAKAYLNRQYTFIAIAGIVLFIIIGFVPGLGW